MHANHLDAEALGQLLLRLYRLARTTSTTEFKGRAFALVRETLPFDSGLWGAHAVTGSGMAVHWLYLDNQPQQLVTDWAQFREGDDLHRAAVSQPGRTIRADLKDAAQAGLVPPELLEHVRRYDLCGALVTATHDPILNLVNSVVFYRGWNSASFTERERAFAESLAPHLAETWDVCALQEVGHGSAHPRGARAIVDRQGNVHNAEPSFSGFVRAEYPAWTGPQIPGAMFTPGRSEGEMFRGKSTGLAAVRELDDGLLIVRAYPLGPAARLTPREMAVARQFAAGLTHREVAEALGLSPTTVRNHVQAIYLKLGISNKVELAALLAIDA